MTQMKTADLYKSKRKFPICGCPFGLFQSSTTKICGLLRLYYLERKEEPLHKFVRISEYLDV